MKISIKFTITALLVFLLTNISSCDQLNKKSATTTDSKPESEKTYAMEPKTTSVFWTGTAFNGQMDFKSDNIKKAKTAKEAIDGINFTMPVASLYTKAETCTEQIKSDFFGKMESTDAIIGSLSVKNDTLVVLSLKMNNISNDIPLSFINSGQMVSMHGKLNLDDWKAQDALISLYTACKQDVPKDASHVLDFSIESYLKVE